MVFLWFSYGFPMVFLWFSYGWRSPLNLSGTASNAGGAQDISQEVLGASRASFGAKLVTGDVRSLRPEEAPKWKRGAVGWLAPGNGMVSWEVRK